MSIRRDPRRMAHDWVDRSWCRLVQSSAGDQVLGVYKARPALADHLSTCEACRAVTLDYSRLAVQLGEMQHHSYSAPPDFVASVLTRLDEPLAPIPRKRSMREKAALAAAATLSATALAVAAVARRRHTAAS